MARIDAFFKLMHEQSASDLHLLSGQPPALRIHGEIERVKYKVLDNDDLRKMLYEITPEDKVKSFEETGDVDFGYEIPGLARYRANYFMQKNGIGAGIPGNSQYNSDRRTTRLAAGGFQTGLIAAGSGDRNRSHRLGKIDHPCHYHRRGQPVPQRSYHHHRGSNRIRAQESRMPGESPGGGAAYQVFQCCVARGLARGPGYHPRGRNEGSGDHFPGHRGQRHRSSGLRHPAHHQCSQDGGSYRGGLSGARTGTDSFDPGRRRPGRSFPRPSSNGSTKKDVSRPWRFSSPPRPFEISSGRPNPINFLP